MYLKIKRVVNNEDVDSATRLLYFDLNDIVL